MNRREFIRTAIATTTLLAVSATGIYEIAVKVGANQSSAQQLQPPLSTSESAQSSATLGSPAASSATSSSQTSSTTSQPSSSAQSSSAAAPAGYVLVAQLSTLGGKSTAYFDHPSHGSSILVSVNGQWKAFSAVCTHRPCTVDFQSSELYCPCHGATFSASNGSVTRGPAPTKLGEYGVIAQDGGVYVSNSFVN